MELGAFRSQPTLGHPASDTNLSPRYPPYARPQRRLAVRVFSRFNAMCVCPYRPAPIRDTTNRRVRHECDATRDVLAGVLLTQNGPRCIQAAAGSCFAFAKRSVLIQTILRYRERLAFALTAACRTWIFVETPFRLTMRGRSNVATPKKTRSIYLTRWSHSSSIRVADFISKAVTSVVPEVIPTLRKQFSVLSCHLSVKSRIWPNNEHTPKPAEIAVTLAFHWMAAVGFAKLSRQDRIAAHAARCRLQHVVTSDKQPVGSPSHRRRLSAS